MNLSAFCIYLLGLVILFPILVVISAVVILKSGLIIADMLVLDLLPFLWMPYKGIDIRDFIALNKSDLDAKGILLAIGILLKRFIEMALWWFIVIFGLYTVYHQRNNAIQVAINQKSFTQKITIIGISIAVYCVLKLIAWIITKVITIKWKNEE